MLCSLFTAFVITYATTQLEFTRSEVLTAILLGSGLQLFPIPLAVR